MTSFLLAADTDNNRARLLLDTCWPLDDRMHQLELFLRDTGTRQLSASHQADLLVGPQHDHFEAALAAYGFTSPEMLDVKIVDRIIELLIAGEILEPHYIDNQQLMILITASLSTDVDWENLSSSSSLIARVFLAESYEGFEEDTDLLDRERYATFGMLAGGIAVAASAARAESLS